MRLVEYSFVRMTIALLMVLGGNTVVHAQDPSPALKFEERVFNFGTVLEKKGKVSHTFVFQNNGAMPVTINDIYSNCGCIGRSHTEEAIQPGAKGKVTVTFDPSYKSGFFSKEIIVYSNNSKHYNRVWVEGTITPTEHAIEDDYPYNFGSGLYLRLKVMAFGYAKPGETKQMQLHYANNTNKPITLSFAVVGKQTGLQFVNPGKIGAKAKGVVTFSYTMATNSSTDALLVVVPSVNGKKLSETVQLKILKESSTSK